LDDQSQPTDDSDQAYIWKTIFDTIAIEEKLLARKIEHFGQAQGTLFNTPHLHRKFGCSGALTEANNLMTNKFDQDDFPPLTRGATTLLNLMSNNNRLPPISTSIGIEDFAKGLRKWSEGTSTSPSGRHLGHY
jgi:hypothetical protein